MSAATRPPQWPTGKLRPDPKERQGHPGRCRSHSPHAGPGDPNHARLPAASGRCTSRVGAFCIWRSQLALSPRDMAASNILVSSSSCMSREVPPSIPDVDQEVLTITPQGSLGRVQRPQLPSLRVYLV